MLFHELFPLPGATTAPTAPVSLMAPKCTGSRAVISPVTGCDGVAQHWSGAPKMLLLTQGLYLLNPEASELQILLVGNFKLCRVGNVPVCN